MLIPAGGLVYHLRALRYSSPLWQEFRDHLRTWIRDWHPKTDALIVVGPSGGHTLPISELGHFREIIALDIDPLAGWVFRIRHLELLRQRRQKLIWRRKDVFFNSHGEWDGSFLKSFLSAHPQHAILFANVLGQLGLQSSNSDFASAPDLGPHSKDSLQSLLKSRAWASYHDRLSGEIPLRSVSLRSPHSLSNSDLLDPFVDRDQLETSGAPLEMTDHLTENWLKGEGFSYFRWQLLPHQWHIIEATFQSDAGPP